MMYAVLPVEVFSNRLSGSEWCVLGVLVAHKGNNCEAWPSVSRIAEITGMAQNNVSRALSSLEKSGMIAREKTGTRNRYTFPCLDHTAQPLDMVFREHESQCARTQQISAPPVIAESATTAAPAPKPEPAPEQPTGDNPSPVSAPEPEPAPETPAAPVPVVVHETPQSAPQAALPIICEPQQGELLPAPAKQNRRIKSVAVQGELLPEQENHKGRCLPKTWQLPRSWGVWAMEELGFTEEEVRYQADKFRDHWISTTRNPAKKDWLATWRNWMRGENEKKQRYNNRPQQKSKTRMAMERLIAMSGGDFEIPF